MFTLPCSRVFLKNARNVITSRKNWFRTAHAECVKEGRGVIVSLSKCEPDSQETTRVNERGLGPVVSWDVARMRVDFISRFLRYFEEDGQMVEVQCDT